MLTTKECAFVVKFLRAVRRVGPLGNEILNEMDFQSATVRRLCSQLAASCRCYHTARKIAVW